MALNSDQQARLASLRAAYDALISGKAVASTEYAGERTMYNRVDPASMARLKDQITSLETQAALPASAPRRRGRAIRFRL
jgi:hypothetical protein